MSEHKVRMLEIMEACVLQAEFCDQCPNANGTYEDCRALHEEFFREVRRSWEAEENENAGTEKRTPADPERERQGIAHY